MKREKIQDAKLGNWLRYPDQMGWYSAASMCLEIVIGADHKRAHIRRQSTAECRDMSSKVDFLTWGWRRSGFAFSMLPP